MAKSTNYDLVVVGGGAAGFFSAISCAEIAHSIVSSRGLNTIESGLNILILEKSGNVLQKVKISGGGRCNVTHDCHDPREFVGHYPRGERTLPGPLHRWNAADMIDWLGDKGIELKVEADGRMFPVTDDSQTIIDCFLNTAKELDIETRCRQEVTDISYDSEIYTLKLKTGESVQSSHLLIATGGTRTPSGAKFAESFGHTTHAAAPSLFTFKITDPRLEELAGISVPFGHAKIEGSKFSETGPILITHWGLSGPGILKLSARAARELQQKDYRFNTVINWIADYPPQQVSDSLGELRTESGKQSIFANPHFAIPSRLWKRLCTAAKIEPDTKWGNISKKELSSLVAQLTNCRFEVSGKSMNKDEFVTCGGINLKEVNFKTMESKLQPNLYFAGEVLDIDGVTGGFNFQSAWTTARIAGTDIANKLTDA